MHWSRIVCVLWLVAPAGASVADEGTRELRFAAIAPEGTAWARESHAFGREVESATGGGVHVKWYFGGIAGDELTELERLKRGQIDGLAGATYCERIAPSLRALEVVGFVSSRDQAARAIKLLQPQVEKEFARTPIRSVFLTLGFGHRVLFSRTPVHSMAELRAGRYWVWDQDEVLRAQLPAMGVHVVALPLEEAARAYEENRIDGFIVIPTAALAFQYSTLARYFTDLQSAYLPGCLAMAEASIDRLQYKQQLQLMDAAAKLRLRVEDIGIRMDEQLLGGNSLFQKQGLRFMPMSASFREEWLKEGRAAYRRLAAQLVPSTDARQLLESLEQH